MSYRATITLDEDSYAFLKSAGGENRSAFINQLLKAEKRRHLAQKLLLANQQEAEDEAYQALLADWNAALSTLTK